MSDSYDVIVVGGGHAGAEAAWASAKCGASVALVTMDRTALGRMSCNPAIGGLGKGQIVREIDALGGLMGLAIDRAGIQFRVLNRRKGAAVRAPRAQADRAAYSCALLDLLSQAPQITIVEGTASALASRPTGAGGSRPRVTGVTLEDGRRLSADAIVLTTGTFLRGLMHCGTSQIEGGRMGEPSSVGMSESLEALGFTLGRLKTGTPPRVHRDTIDYDSCEIQPGDDPPAPFSFLTDSITQPQIPCWITHTSIAAHDCILANLDRAPLYCGQIQSTGPRYCPSIEDKVVRFADKSRHQIFLEPEGYDDQRIYCNGIATSLPRDVQEAFLHEIPGLGQARIIQYGYAIEYDWIPTHQTHVSLESKPAKGLFLAGQINGTSGYEEAAGQGLVAGVNAVRSIGGEQPFLLARDQAYIGVMIDDLVTRPPTEPYRMFTSRAEYRLQLRSDNADQRLTPIGRQLGTVDDWRWARFQQKSAAIAHIETLCKGTTIDGIPASLWSRRPEADVEALAGALRQTDHSMHSTDNLDQFLIDTKYSGYLVRQNLQVERFRRLESMPIPDDMDYASISQLRLEARELLGRFTPRTLGQASRISGINPADITLLWIHASRRRPLRPTA